MTCTSHATSKTGAILSFQAENAAILLCVSTFHVLEGAVGSR
jgi:hypothetical protein